MPLSFMKTSWLFQLANKNSLCFDGILISARFVKKSGLFIDNCTNTVYFFFLPRIYMFDSRSWLSTVARENVSREIR